MKKHTVFITGASGYVGVMLVRMFARRDDVERIIGLDKEPMPIDLLDLLNYEFYEMNTVEAWEEKVAAFKPDIVINTAWQIRDIYGNPGLQRSWNIDGTNKVFDFVFNTESVEAFVDYSTVSSYAPFATNEVTYRFKESDPFRTCDLLYAEEKREAEESLKTKYDAAVKRGRKVNVTVLRPAAITGPRGRFSRTSRFGLQAALSGQLEGSFWYKIVTLMTSFVPATPKWVRQFVHEDDMCDVTEMMALTPKAGYNIYNVCPPGEPVFAKDLAKSVGKRVLPIYPWMVHLAFFVMWNITRGSVPTAPGSWKGYSYPIVVDGSKLVNEFGYKYRMSSFDALYYTDGRYYPAVPNRLRRPMPEITDPRIPKAVPGEF
jgi:nucleoside-diphosphate-sugar epimerase